MVTTENCFNQGFIAFSIKLKELTSLDFDSFRATKLIFGVVLSIIIVALPFFPKCEKHFSVAALIQVTIYSGAFHIPLPFPSECLPLRLNGIIQLMNVPCFYDHSFCLA